MHYGLPDCHAADVSTPDEPQHARPAPGVHLWVPSLADACGRSVPRIGTLPHRPTAPRPRSSAREAAHLRIGGHGRACGCVCGEHSRGGVSGQRVPLVLSGCKGMAGMLDNLSSSQHPSKLVVSCWAYAVPAHPPQPNKSVFVAPEDGVATTTRGGGMPSSDATIIPTRDPRSTSRTDFSARTAYLREP